MIEVEGRQFGADLEVVTVLCCAGCDALEDRGAVGRQVHRFGHDAERSEELAVFVPHAAGPEREVEDHV